MAGNGPTPNGPDVNAEPKAPANPQAQKPTLWRNLLGGALLGLAGGMAAPNEGAGVGMQEIQNLALNPRRVAAQEQEAQAQQTMAGAQQQNAQTNASRTEALNRESDALTGLHTVNTLMLSQQLKYMPYQFQAQLAHENGLLVSDMAKSGIQPVAIIDDSQESITAAMNQYKNKQVFPVWMPGASGEHGKVALFDASTMRSNMVPSNGYTFHLFNGKTLNVPGGMSWRDAVSMYGDATRAFTMQALGSPGDPNSTMNWARMVESGQAKLSDVPMGKNGAIRNAVINAVANDGNLVLPLQTRAFLQSLAGAEAELTKFQATLNDWLSNKSLNNGIRLRTERESFARFLGRALGEKGVFTDQDKQDFARLLGPGLLISTTDPQLAQQQINDLQSLLATVKTQHLQNAFATFSKKDVFNNDNNVTVPNIMMNGKKYRYKGPMPPTDETTSDISNYEEITQ